MITGLIIRNFKTYKGLNYIPISNGSNYCGLIGQNGIGKSSILEALDCFFNENKKWNKNVDAKSEKSYIMPIFLFDKKEFNNFEQLDFLQIYSDSTISFIQEELPSTMHQQRKPLWEDIKKQHSSIDLSDKYLIPICLDEYNNISLGICGDEIIDKVCPIAPISDELLAKPVDDKERREALDTARKTRNKDVCEKIKYIFDWLKTKITFVYIPKDIEPERFVAFETEEIQHLIGTNLITVVKKQLKDENIKTISTGLKEFIQGLSDTLPDYEFKMKGTRQLNLNSKDIYNLIIHDFFSKRELIKKLKNGQEIPLSQLSSGEKQQAIITFIHSIVKNYRNNNKYLIVAIDEPESALHISLCYEQFEKLYEISKKCCQVIFSSHWYGFIPTISNGSIANITMTENGDKHTAILFNIYRYREEIKQGISHTQGQIPIDVTLKGNNDFIQSIISSIIKPNSYNWLICEGTSDKIYLETYLKNEIIGKKLRIVPVGGAKEVKRIYEYLNLAFADLKSEIKGKVFLLVDTDEDFLNFDTKDTFSNLRCNRIVNCSGEKETKLINNQSNPKKKTDIEDALNGKIFNKTLKKFREDNTELSFLDEQSENEKQEIPSYFAMNLRVDEYEQLEHFFSKEKNKNKVLFAEAYINELNNGNYKVPSWINEIKKFYGYEVN